MSKKFGRTFRRFVKRVGNEARPVLITALRTGATQVGNELKEVSQDVNQSPEVLLQRIGNVLRNGAVVAGQELMTQGLNRVNALSSSNIAADFPELFGTKEWQA